MGVGEQLVLSYTSTHPVCELGTKQRDAWPIALEFTFETKSLCLYKGTEDILSLTAGTSRMQGTQPPMHYVKPHCIPQQGTVFSPAPRSPGATSEALCDGSSGTCYQAQQLTGYFPTSSAGVVLSPDVVMGNS